MKTESTLCSEKPEAKVGSTRGWPPARRKAQAANARKTKPWQHATGPRTEAGKDRSSLNSTKHGRNSAAARDLRALLVDHARMLATLDLWPREQTVPSPCGGEGEEALKSSTLLNPWKNPDRNATKTP